jgi:hypothetical protein
MSVFDLVFLLAMLVTAMTLILLAAFLLTGRFRLALRTISIYAICAMLYLGTGIAVSYFRPNPPHSASDPWCFDDWCLALDKVSRTAAAPDIAYRLDLRVFSRARRVAQRAKGAWIYLIDDKGRLYPPEPNASDVPLDVLLQPEESVTTSRVFRVPADVQHLGLITGHGGAYCGPTSFLIIGDTGCLFNKPEMIRIQ